MIFHDWYWLVWLVIFLVYELWGALNRKPGDTLSESVWDWFAVRRPQAKHGRLRRGILALFLSALTGHLVYGLTVMFVIILGFGMAWSIWFHYRHEVKS